MAGEQLQRASPNSIGARKSRAMPVPSVPSSRSASAASSRRASGSTASSTRAPSKRSMRSFVIARLRHRPGPTSHAPAHADGVVTSAFRNHRRTTGLRLQPGLHGLWRVTRRGARREDPQDPEPRPQDRRAADRSLRRRGGAHPRGRRRVARLRRDLLPQRPRLWRYSPDQRGARTIGRRSRLLPRAHRLHLHGGRYESHVHHRARTS